MVLPKFTTDSAVWNGTMVSVTILTRQKFSAPIKEGPSRNTINLLRAPWPYILYAYMFCFNVKNHF